MTTEAKLAETLEAISNEIGQLETKRERGIDSKALCETYKKTKPMLESILPVIEKFIPNGKQIAVAIRFLMGLADSACGAS